MEKTGYISSAGGSLFRVLHTPESPPRLAILFIAPYGDEKRAAHGTSVRLARALCESGCAVLRFDCMGTGDSSGKSHQTSISGMETDCRAAAAELRRLFPSTPLALLGVRLGGSIALTLAGELGAVRTVAIAPVIDGRSWLRQERGRRKLRQSMVRREMAAMGIKPSSTSNTPLPPETAEDLSGLAVGADFIKQIESFDLSRSGSAPDHKPSSLIIQISPRKTPLPEVERAAERLSADVRCMHIEPFWQPLEPGAITALTDCLRAFFLENGE